MAWQDLAELGERLLAVLLPDAADAGLAVELRRLRQDFPGHCYLQLGLRRRPGDAEGWSRAYRASVDVQRAANRTGVPRLSTDAEAASVALRAAPDQAVRAEVWQAV